MHHEGPDRCAFTRSTINNITTVDCVPVARNAGPVVVSATWLDATIGDGFAGEGWTVRIPESNVTGIEVKRLSWLRTGVTVLGITAATVLGFDALGSNNEGSGGGGGGSNPL